MKKLVLLFGFFLILLACGSKKQVQQDQLVKNNDKTVIAHEPGDTIHIKNEELEYEIIIIENGFDSWLVTQKPMEYYTESWLEQKNYQLVTEWNRRVHEPFRFNPNLYEQIIDYRPNIHYGLEVNYLLYMYFKFFQQKYNQRLLPGQYMR